MSLATLAVFATRPAPRAGLHSLSSPAARGSSTYGFDVRRTGYNPDERTLGPENVGGLRLLWRFELGAVTITSPVVAPRVEVDGAPVDLVIVGTEHGDVFALDASNGRVVWHDRLGSVHAGCPQIPDGIYGAHMHAWGAITEFDGMLYATVAGMCDALPNYGRVVAIDARTAWTVGT